MRYPQALARLPVEQLRSIGEEYLERTRIQRKSGTPRFIDKLPNNFLHTGFIHLMLPNAKHHRRPAPSARLLLLRFQAAFCARPELYL